jgi:hypothetical protein
MPKLNPTKAAEVKKAGEEGSKFILLPIGAYRVKLMDVESKESAKGDPMWVWTFQTVEFLDGEAKNDKGEPINVVGKEQRYWTVIKDNTLWDLDRVFAAFNCDPDTDTDELIGDEIVVQIDQSIITKGKAKGKMGNEISDFFTLEDGLAKSNEDFESVEGGSTDEPPF